MKKKTFANLCALVLCALFAPSAARAEIFTGPKATVDADSSALGIVRVRYNSVSGKRFKVRVTKGSTNYNYDLNQKGNYETYPLQMGEGKYTVTVFENVSGASYAQAYQVSFDVKYESENAPFLQASQYVNFTGDSLCVKKAEALCKNLETDLEKIQAIYEYVTENYVYDTEKAQSVKSGYLPDLDKVYKAKKGICFDYSALLAAMLRSQGIPCRMLTGYVPEQQYHAWNEIYTQEEGWVTKVLYFNGKKWELTDSTFGAAALTNEKLNKFIGDGKNYTLKYTY